MQLTDPPELHWPCTFSMNAVKIIIHKWAIFMYSPLNNLGSFYILMSERGHGGSLEVQIVGLAAILVLVEPFSVSAIRLSQKERIAMAMHIEGVDTVKEYTYRTKRYGRK